MTVPALSLKFDLKVNGSKVNFVTKARVEASFKGVSSQKASWRAQLYFRQLKVKLYESTVDGSSADQYQQAVSKLQSALGRSLGKYLSAQQDRLNKQLAKLEQQYFM